MTLSRSLTNIDQLLKIGENQGGERRGEVQCRIGLLPAGHFTAHHLPPNGGCLLPGAVSQDRSADDFLPTDHPLTG